MHNRRVVLIGAVHESLPALRALAAHPEAELVCAVTLNEEASASVAGVVDLAGQAAALGVDTLRVRDANDPDSVERIAAYRPALIVVVGWTRLIHPGLLSVPPLGCIGFHASLLPKHRGRAPVNWAIINGETVTGNTMMLLNEGIDSGLIVDQRRTPIYLDDDCGTVYGRVADLGADMLTDNLASLLEGTALLRRQDENRVDMLPKRVPAMGVTDWRRSPVEVHNWIRGQTVPYPGAFTGSKGDRVMLWSSEPPRLTSYCGLPGEVLQVTSEGVRVAAGPGSIMITRLGDPRREPEPAEAWAHRHGLRPGARFELPSAEVVAWSLGQGPRPVDMPQPTEGQS